MIAEPDGALRIRAPAKINLYLHVTGRREDGYHLLDSLVVFAGLADFLEIRPGRGLTLSVDGPFADRAGPVEENLVTRAARALADKAGIEAGAAIKLTKNIPAAAGLGGGSADAAAALTGLSRFWNIPEGAVNLPATGLSLGADIPACLVGRPAFVGGVGEKIEPAPALPACGLLLVNPGIALSTPSVFAGRRGGFSPPARFTEPPASAGELADLLADRHNDLTDAACRLTPVIADVIEALASVPGCRLARMTGSGATCFGLFDDRAAAEASLPAIQRDGWWSAATELS